jgi:hypothetical protein
MEEEILKHQIKIALEPVRAMLIYKLTILEKKKWLEFVRKTCASIGRKPEQYLAAHLLTNKVLAITLVYKIFKELAKEWKGKRYITVKRTTTPEVSSEIIDHQG